MDAVIRALTIYLVLLIIFRISGKRSLAQTTPFDLILTLIISEAIQQAMIDSDNSITHAFILVITLVGVDVLFSVAKQRSETVDKLIEGRPVVVMEKGKVNRDFLKMERIDESDVLQAARGLLGISNEDEIEYAIMEQSGQITIVPRKKK